MKRQSHRHFAGWMPGLCLLLGGLCCSGDASAQSAPAAAKRACASGLESATVQKLGYMPEAAGKPGGIVSVCKPWPAHPGLSIMAVAAPHPGAVQAEEVRLYDLEVVLVRSGDRHILSRFKQQQAILSTAERFDRLGIDTARFKLKRGKRAFGVTVHYSRDADAVLGAWTRLNLYLPEGRKLRLVLDGLLVSGEQGGNDCADRTSTRRTLAIGAKTHYGFADLLVTSSITTTEHRQVDGGCDSGTVLPPSVEHNTLEFYRRAYVVPQDW